MSFIFLLLFTVILSSPLFINGLQSDGSYLINGGHDVFWHLSLIKEITGEFPPQFPGLSGTSLQNYHYLTHLILSFVPKLTDLPIPFLYFKIYNPLLVFLLCLVVYKTAVIITHSRYQSLITTFVTLFSGSLAFLIHDTPWKGSLFKLDQPYDQLYNLHTTLGYILVFTIIYWVVKYQYSKNISYLYWSTFILVLLAAVKVFFALPLLVGIISLVFVSKDIPIKDKFLLTANCFFLPLFAFSFIHSSSGSPASSLAFAPFWLLQKMTESINLPYFQDLLLKQQHYQSTSNSIRLIQITLVQFLIYLLGNLWVRLFGISTIFSGKFFNNATRPFLVASVLVSILLPIFVVTKPDNFNTVQFGQTSVLFLSFLTGIYLSQLPINTFLKITIALAISLTFFHDFFFTHKYSDFTVSSTQLQVIDYLVGKSREKDVILVNNGDQYDMIIPALAGRRSYFNGIKVAQLLGYDYASREQQNNDFFTGRMSPLEAETFIISNDIRFILMLKDTPLIRKYGLENRIKFENTQFQIINIK